MSLSNSRKVTIRLSCSRKLHDLPKEILHMICDELPIESLQQLSLTSKSVRAGILTLCREVQLTRVNVPRPEIIKKISKVLAINCTNPDYDVFRKTLLECNIVRVKVQASLTRSQIKYLTMIMKDFGRVKQVCTPTNKVNLWNTFKKMKKAKFIVVSMDAGLPDSVIQSVDLRHVPGVSVDIQAFNVFRKAAILKLQRNRKLDTLEEALSMNSIMLSSRPRTYNLATSVQTVSSINVENVFTDEEIINAGFIVGEIAEAIESGVVESKEAMKRLHERFRDASGFVERCLTMFDNLLQKINPRWQIANMTEDTLAFMILDPVMNAFLDNSIDVEYHGADYELPESRGRKLMLAMKYNQPTKNVRGRKPDRSASSIYGRHVFLAELKTAKNAHDRSDVVKIGIMMKDVIDMALQKGFQREEASVVGLLVEGEHCSVHLMQSPSQAFYRMHQIREFKLPKDQRDLKVLLNTAVSLELCRALVIRAVEQSSVAPEEEAQDVRWSSFSPPHHAEYYA